VQKVGHLAQLAKCPTESNRSRFRKACKKASKLINASRREHISSALEEAAGGMRKLWLAVNGLLHPDRPGAVDDPSWAKTLSLHFSEKVSRIGRSVDTLIGTSCVAAPACDPVFLLVTGMKVVSQPGVATTQPHTYT